MEKISLTKLSREISKPWSPIDVLFANNSVIRMAQVKGKFVWHRHDKSDEVFFVLDGEFTLETEEGSFNLKKDECILVPKGTLHRSKSESFATVLVFELQGTKPRGNESISRL